MLIEFETKEKKSLQEIDNIILKSSLNRNLNKNEIDRLEIYKEYNIKKDIKFESFGENDILGLGNDGIGNKLFIIYFVILMKQLFLKFILLSLKCYLIR